MKHTMIKNLLFLFLAIFFFYAALPLAAVPVISAVIENDSYKPGDIITLKIQVRDNPGLHGLYFHLAYDSRYLALENVGRGLMIDRISGEKEFHYASGLANRLITGFTLVGNATITRENGIVAEAYFRVLGSAPDGTILQFTFEEYGVRDGDGVVLPGAEWEDSSQFRITDSDPDAYIIIRQPYNNQTFHTDTLLLNALCTARSDYGIIIENGDSHYQSGILSAAGGSVQAHEVPLSYGFNRIKANLVNDSGTILATDVTTVLRAEDDKFIKITQPANHSLVNTDMVTVRVTSSFDNVIVCGLEAEKLEEEDGDNLVFTKDIWLTRGFNTITARAVGPMGEIYTDEIDVYYQKNDSLFRFLTPLDGQVIKTNQPALLHIRGEIGSKYDRDQMENRITLKAIYYPNNPLLPARVLMDNSPTEITHAAAFSGITEAPYIFQSPEPLDLAGLSRGRIELIAFKNKQGGSWEDAIHRNMYVDNSNLEINLIRPNIFSTDTLDSPERLKDFNHGTYPQFNRMELRDNGSFAIQQSRQLVQDLPDFSNLVVRDIMETRRGDLYILVNDNLTLKVFKKEFGEQEWVMVHANKNLYGYSLCETDIGILIGTSNRFAGNNSGLYLLDGNRLTNIIIGCPIAHVQFIVNHDGTIYLYGNEYSHLYSFNIFTLEEDLSPDGTKRLKAATVREIPFDNGYSIAQFELSNDAKTAVIRTKQGQVFFYQHVTDRGFTPALGENDFYITGNLFQTVVKGEYENGDYNAYLLLSPGVISTGVISTGVISGGDAVVVMEEKETHRLLVNPLEIPVLPGQELSGAGFRKDNFYIVFKNQDMTYTVRQAQILFHTIYWGFIDEQFLNNELGDPVPVNQHLFITRDRSYFLGYGNETQLPGILRFYREFPGTGDVSFSYINPDVDGLRGISFEIDPVWLTGDYIRSSIRVMDMNDDSPLFAFENLTISSFLQLEDPRISVHHHFNNETLREKISIDFTSLLPEVYLEFDIILTSLGDVTPTLSTLAVHKKIPVKLPRGDNAIVYFPIQGYIFDPTVEQVYIQEVEIPLLRNGSFFYNYPINASEEKVPVRIFCQNVQGETCTLTFNVRLFDSINDLARLEITDAHDPPVQLSYYSGNSLRSTTNTIYIRGDYFGLFGAKVGYETYSYEYDEESVEYMIPVSRGLFETTRDEILNPDFDITGTGFVSGTFSHQPVPLIPGLQRLVVYVENPGGHRTEYMLGEVYPDIIYDLPEDEQRICVTNIEVSPLGREDQYESRGIPVEYSLSLEAYEKQTGNVHQPYAFKREYRVIGAIQSLEEFTDLRIKSYDPALTFENGSDEILVEVDILNRFQVDVFINLPEQCEEKTYIVGLIPTAPYLDTMKTGLEIRVRKNFENTHIIPGFSLMEPEQWTDEEKRRYTKQLYVTFGRFIPESAHLHVRVNFETADPPLEGHLVELNPGERIYKVLRDPEPVYLSGVKPGVNRVSWSLSYDNGKIISSSSSRNFEMQDFIFTMEEQTGYTDTEIIFPMDPEVYYDNENDVITDDIPLVEIKKDTATWMRLTLNSRLVWENNSGETGYTCNLFHHSLMQGRNYLLIEYQEKNNELLEIKKSFLYDSLEPEVEIATYDYDDDYTYLEQFSVIVKEANIAKTELFYGEDIISDTDCYMDTHFMGHDQYRITFGGLEVKNPLIVPRPDTPVRVRVIDHAGHAPVFSDAFTGLDAFTWPPETLPYMISLTTPVYNPALGIINSDDPGVAPFTTSWKFFNESIVLRDQTGEGDLIIERDLVQQRPQDLYIGPGFGVEPGYDLAARAGNSIRFLNNTHFKPGSTFRGGTGDLYVSPVPEMAGFRHLEDARAMSFGFYFRLENHDYYTWDGDEDGGHYRRILTIYEEEENNDVTSIFLAYKDVRQDITDDMFVYLVEEHRTRSLNPDRPDEVEQIVILSSYTSDYPYRISPGWHMVALSVDGDRQVFGLSVGDNVPQQVVYNGDEPSEIFDTILDYDNSVVPLRDYDYYFGSILPADSGHFSITMPFYINRMITTEDVQDFAEYYPADFVDTFTEPRRLYSFNTPDDDLGESFYQLRISGEPGSHFAYKENADYTEPASCGSLRAASLHNNYLKESELGDIVFVDSSIPVTYNMDVLKTSGSFRLAPRTGMYPGRYFFGTTMGNHGLTRDTWYTVNGTVLGIENQDDPDELPVLVLRINGRDETYPLREGDFTFIYDGSTVGAPDTVVMYIETRVPVEISKHLVLTEGNYGLPEEGILGIPPSCASTKYLFSSMGTMEFWYKPLNVNPDGFVSYPVCIVDSEYIRVFTENRGTGYTTFSAEIKGLPHPLVSTIPVHAGWQYLQVSYSVEDRLIYFYVDGKMAARFEGGATPFPICPSMNGQAPLEDNVCFGATLNHTLYAEGYIDDIRISHLYKRAEYESNMPLTFAYTEEDGPQLSITNLLDESAYTDIRYILRAKDDRFYQLTKPGLPSDHGLPIQMLSSGGYLLRAAMNINGHRFTQTFSFTKDDRPRFIVKKFTPLIISGVPTDIGFDIVYDDFYLLNPEVATYAGFAVRLTGENNTPLRTLYITQGYTLQDHGKWFVSEPGVPPRELDVHGNEIHVIIDDIITLVDLAWDLRTFYFRNTFTAEQGFFETLAEQEPDISPPHIPVAGIQSITKSYLGDSENGIEYKLEIQVGTGTSPGYSDMYDDLSIGYRIPLDENDAITATAPLNAGGRVMLYYDDILESVGYGTYDCYVSLRYKGQSYDVKQETLHWQPVVEESAPPIGNQKRLYINDFSLLYLDREANNARLYLEYEQNGLEGEMECELSVLHVDTGERTTYGPHLLSPLNTFVIIPDIPVPEGNSYIFIKVFSIVDEIERFAELNVVNSLTAPDIVLTNTVDSLIPFNNVMFSWIGYHEGEYKSDIEYMYNFDGTGWSAPSSIHRRLELYSLEEGYHRLRVKARYKGEESAEEIATFFVDVSKPAFDSSKIIVDKQYDFDGFLESITIYGSAGAVQDSSLSSLFLNDVPVAIGENGTFSIEDIPVLFDGMNIYRLTAYDRVGNFTDYNIEVNNPITGLLFPKGGSEIVFAPMTLVGSLHPDITARLDIFIHDPLCPGREPGNFTGWKKAKINEDRTFFAEDIFINPGSALREAHTPLTLAVKTYSGRIYTRQIDTRAREILMPIEMNLSTHTVEGENAETEIEISCVANVNNISSWSIDYTGDGIYDEVRIVDNPDLGKQQRWTHVYSSIGLVKPRVRIITLEGRYFSVCDEIIIHEKIKEASNKLITDPIAMDAIKMEDNSERIHILTGGETHYEVQVYEVGRNETYISNKLFTINLDGLGIEHPVAIAVFDKDTFYLAENRAGLGYIHVLRAGEFGNYILRPEHQTVTTDTIHDMAVGPGYIGATLTNSDVIVRVPVADGMPVPDEIEYIRPEIKYAEQMHAGAGIAADHEGILVSDFYTQRLIRFTEDLVAREFTGSFGDGEGQFIKPALIKTYENRIFVYDRGRYDIQIFDPEFKPITHLSYDVGEDDNYIAPEFLNDVVGLDIIARIEGMRLFYYALILSRSSGKLAMLRLPQWEELRARVRNNKIVFLNDREVYTAKPTGSDLARIISTDSIPRIEGTVDYPALSPDGRSLVFTSRVQLYDGNGGGLVAGNIHAYDNLYVMDITREQSLRRIPLGELNTFEIERPVFNSNGDMVIFSAKPTGGLWQIYTYHLKTGGIEQLFSSDENARFPYFSPDDRFVVFTTDYDGDEEVEIIDTENTTVRVSVTANNCRDSFPVWTRVYPYEIQNPDLDIDSKIAFVSEREYHKGVYYTYISRPYESDVRIVTSQGVETGDNPDSAALEITSAGNEGDYPCFTGDSQAVVMEHFDGMINSLKRYEYTSEDFYPINLPDGARRPAGMKNTIANFTATAVNGDQVALNWTPYTDNEIFYTIRFKVNQENEPFVQKKVFTRDNALIQGLEMGMEYLFKVCIMENEEEAASTRWEKVKMPEVVSRPTIEIDPDNPYRVNLFAWKPDEDTEWKFSWIIDNQEIAFAQTSQYFTYEFATSGHKEIVLKTTNKAGTRTSISEPVAVTIVTDIVPVIEYSLIYSDATYVELSSEQSKGNRIKSSSSVWRISGPGREATPPYEGDKVIIPLTGFRHKINVNLKITREYITGQASTDIIEKNLVIDLDYKDIKPVITYIPDTNNPRLIAFSGENSIGNINWPGARWYVNADGQIIFQETGTSTFAFLFPEAGTYRSYSVTLTVPSAADGTTKTTSALVSVDPAPLEPVIDYEILTLTDSNGNTTGAKVLLSCGNSRGNNIDFSQARWNVPVAGTYGESPTQIGPTAIYNLTNIGKETYIDVSLTLIRRSGTDQTMVTEKIMVDSGNITATHLDVNITSEETSAGTVLIFDVLNSTGPNIEWEKTQWVFAGNQPMIGPVVRQDISESGENQVFRWVCTLFRHGDIPLTKNGEIILNATKLKPAISYKPLPGESKNVYELSVTNTRGVNIDWERTTWYIYDGNENVIQKYGARISHAFAFKSEAKGYPVMVEMFYKGNTYPFVGYTSIDVEGDVLVPVLQWDTLEERSDEYVVHFCAEGSTGSNIDWSQTKWTFGDSSEAQYGPTAVHKYPISGTKRSYKVSLTLTRRSANGSTETKVKYDTINFTAQELTPVITVEQKSGGYLVLSASDSRGRGLLLDRSLWIFEGDGDNQSLTVNQKVGKIKSESYSESSSSGSSSSTSWNFNASATAGYQDGVVATVTVGGGMSGSTSSSDSYSDSYTINTTSYDGFKDNTESFSSSNIHTGAVCRKYIGTYDISSGEKDRRATLMVTLFVYRITPDGGMTGTSVTYNLDIANLKEGDHYE